MEYSCVICFNRVDKIYLQIICIYSKCMNKICKECYDFFDKELVNDNEYYAYLKNNELAYCSINCAYANLFYHSLYMHNMIDDIICNNNEYKLSTIIRNSQHKTINYYENKKYSQQLNKIFIKDLSNIICEYLSD